MRKAFTVVSDIYPDRTTEVATAILPSAMWVEKEGVMGQTDRRSQFIPKLIDPPGEAKPDFWQIKEVAKRIAKKLGRKDLGFETEEEAWNEYRRCTKGTDVDLWGATREKLKAHAGGVQWPCPSTDFDNRGSNKRFISKEYAKKVFGKTTKKYSTGYVTLYDQHLEDKKLEGPVNYYGTNPLHGEPKGKALIRAVNAEVDFEMPDKEYPYVLNTGRVIEHWHTGTMTMRVRLLRELNPEAYVEISPQDADRLGIKNGQNVRITSPRGSIVLSAWITDRAQPGMVFVPWFDENKLINDLTVDDPKSWSKAGEPNYKVCKCKVERA
jgi:nitrate reductase NapA